jgi:glycosyltransferase involved in cell wall biosynthesis
VEALASGKPVIALARGGSVEIVQNGCGVLYGEPTEEGLEGALRRLDDIEHLIEPGALQTRAAEFSEAQFDRRFLDTLARFWSRGSADSISQFVYNLGKT